MFRPCLEHVEKVRDVVRVGHGGISCEYNQIIAGSSNIAAKVEDTPSRVGIRRD